MTGSALRPWTGLLRYSSVLPSQPWAGAGVWERDRRNGRVGSLGKGQEPQETSQLGPSRKQDQPPHPVTVGEGRGGCLGFLSSSTSLAWRPQVPQDNDSNCSTAGLPVCEAGRGWSRGGLGEWQRNPGMAAFLGAALSVAPLSRNPVIPHGPESTESRKAPRVFRTSKPITYGVRRGVGGEAAGQPTTDWSSGFVYRRDNIKPCVY